MPQEHHQSERNHQGIDNRLIERLPEQPGDGVAPTACRSRLGGWLKVYHRAAA